MSSATITRWIVLLNRKKSSGTRWNLLDGKTQKLRAEGLHRILSTTISGNAAAEIIDLPCHVFRRCLCAVCSLQTQFFVVFFQVLDEDVAAIL